MHNLDPDHYSNDTITTPQIEGTTTQRQALQPQRIDNSCNKDGRKNEATTTTMDQRCNID
jgi:hypothetical protein